VTGQDGGILTRQDVASKGHSLYTGTQGSGRGMCTNPSPSPAPGEGVIESPRGAGFAQVTTSGALLKDESFNDQINDLQSPAVASAVFLRGGTFYSSYLQPSQQKAICGEMFAHALAHAGRQEYKLQTTRATSVCDLRHDRMEQGPTEPHAGRSTFLLNSGGAGGEDY
jgi:hypothetical protein